MTKSVNDRFGHPAGDLVLRRAAGAVQATVRQADVVGRIGGEEFAVLLPDCGPDAARALAERTRQAVAALPFTLPLMQGGTLVQHRQTVSVGVATLLPGMDGAAELIRCADLRLYAAKHAGRDRVAA
ncbi:MAG: GGDEF domain-containing protein [Aquabacterium sp.]